MDFFKYCRIVKQFNATAVLLGTKVVIQLFFQTTKFKKCTVYINAPEPLVEFEKTHHIEYMAPYRSHSERYYEVPRDVVEKLFVDLFQVKDHEEDEQEKVEEESTSMKFLYPSALDKDLLKKFHSYTWKFKPYKVFVKTSDNWLPNYINKETKEETVKLVIAMIYGAKQDETDTYFCYRISYRGAEENVSMYKNFYLSAQRDPVEIKNELISITATYPEVITQEFLNNEGYTYEKD